MRMPRQVQGLPSHPCNSTCKPAPVAWYASRGRTLTQRCSAYATVMGSLNQRFHSFIKGVPLPWSRECVCRRQVPADSSWNQNTHVKRKAGFPNLTRTGLVCGGAFFEAMKRPLQDISLQSLQADAPSTFEPSGHFCPVSLANKALPCPAAPPMPNMPIPFNVVPFRKLSCHLAFAARSPSPTTPASNVQSQ